MILARHAEALFWAGRQLERVEHAARVLDVTARNSMHFVPSRSSLEWQRILAMLGLSEAFATADRALDANQVTWFVFAEAANPGAVANSATQLRENVRTVRDRVPVELWEEANRLHLDLTRREIQSALEAEPFETLMGVRRSCQTITGVITEAMPRDEGYTFLMVGRMLERSTLICRLLRHGLFGAAGPLDVTVLLRMASSLQAFRRSHGYDARPDSVARFLMMSNDMPRSLIACLRQAEHRLTPLQAMSSGVEPARHILGRLRSDLEFGVVRTALEDPDAYLLHVEVELANFAQAIGVSAFDPAQTEATHSQFVRPGADIA